MSGDHKLTTVIGWVTPVAGHEGIRVAVAPDSGQEFLVLHKGAGVDLLGHISAKVEVSGQADPPAPGDEAPPRLTVRSYRVLDDDWGEET